MKRSKVFLTITTALLAIAGIAATKAYRSLSTTVYYCTLFNVTTQKCAVGHCPTVPFSTKYTVSGAGPRGYYKPAGVINPPKGYWIYTNSTCTIPGYLSVD